MRRRDLAAVLPLAMAGTALAQPAGDAEMDAARDRLAAVPGETVCLIEAFGPRGRLATEHRADAPSFVGSCLKTFILAEYLRQVEAGSLSLDEQLPVNDGHRSLVSPVLGELTGTAPARIVLEAMISHSDNTATDIALAKVGIARVRALIAAAGMRQTRLTRSTRIMFSAMAGAPPGTDLGWPGVLAAMQAHVPGTGLPAINPHETMVSSARDLVSWYESALARRWFQRQETLAEFRRIHTMADAMALLVPEDAAAWGKGGSIGWDGFQALAVAGAMASHGVRARFCFAVNWRGEADSVPAKLEAIRAPAAAILARAVAALA